MAKGNVEKFPSEQLNQKDISIQYTPKKKKDCQRMKMKTHFHHECLKKTYLALTPPPPSPFNYFLKILAGNRVQLTESYRDK